MIAAVADTHTALWHLFDDTRLSATAGAMITEAAAARRKIAISTISLAEAVYLVEKNRLPASAYEELTQALADPEHVFTEAVFTTAIVQAMRRVSRAEVPDMPDRIVAATAVYFDVPVISRDRRDGLVMGRGPVNYADIYADCCLGDFVNTISNTSRPAPTTIALSATLKAGHWCWPI